MFDPFPSPCLAATLSQIHRIPKLPIRRIPRLAGVKSISDKLPLLQIFVQTHFLFQLARENPSPHQHSNSSPNLAQFAHSPSNHCVTPFELHARWPESRGRIVPSRPPTVFYPPPSAGSSARADSPRSRPTPLSPNP